MPDGHQGNKAFVDAKVVEEIKQELSIYFHFFDAHFQDHRFLDSLLICSSLLLLVLVGLSLKACCEGEGGENDGPPGHAMDEDETALEMSSVWRRFRNHLFMWVLWPLTILGALLLVPPWPCTKNLAPGDGCIFKASTMFRTSWKSITGRLQVYNFQYLCVALLLTGINVIMVSYFLWNFKMDIDSKLVSPVEYHQAYLFNLLLLSLVVMSYTDKTFEDIIATRQEDVKKQSEAEEALDEKSAKLNTVDDVLNGLRTYYETHFGELSAISPRRRILSWLGPFVVMLIHSSIPRLWMHCFHGAPFLPRKETSTDVHEQDKFVIWVQSMLVHNWVVSVIGGTVFMHMYILCIAEFTRVKEQLLLLDALTTNGFDQLSPHDQVRLKEITYQNVPLIQRRMDESYESYVPLVERNMLVQERMDVLIGRPSPDASPSRKKRWEEVEEEVPTWEPPLELQLSTAKGVRLWWRARQWLSFDVRDERATMEMLLSFALFIVLLCFVGSFVWYLYVGQLTLIACMAFYDGCVLLIFVFVSLNCCIEVNELMMNDSLMLTNMRYYMAIHKEKTLTNFEVRSRKEEEEAVDKLLSILIVKIERLDEPQKVFGFAIDSALRTKFVSAIVLSLASTVVKVFWQLVHGEGVFVDNFQQLFNNTNVTHVAQAMTGWPQLLDESE